MPGLRACILAAMLSACAQNSHSGSGTAEPAAIEESLSVESSRPVANSTVTGPVNAIELHFSRPARLIELTLTGPDGSVMPTMVTSAGEQQHYNVPVSVEDRGSYRVAWRANAAGTQSSGSFAFTVR